MNIFEKYGFWSRPEGFTDLRKTEIISRRRRNLKGYRLIAPTVFLNEGSENHTDFNDLKCVNSKINCQNNYVNRNIIFLALTK